MPPLQVRVPRKAGRPAGSLKGERKDEIVATALNVFAESGYHSCSLAKVAEAVGVSQATVLHHVGSKDGLLVEVLHLRDRLDAELLDRVPEPFGWGAFEYMITVLEANTRRPKLVGLYIKVAGEALTPDHPAASWLRSHFDQSVGLLMFSLAMGIGDGTVRPDIPMDRVARTFVALLDGLQLQWLENPEAVDMVACAHDALDAIKERWSLPAE